MKTIALLFALCGSEPMRTEKPPCTACKGYGLRACYITVVEGHWLKVPGFKWCDDCGGYGREKTIYGGLLRERR